MSFPDSGKSLMSLFEGLEREEILQVLSQGVCHHCQNLLHNRVLTFLNNKLNDSWLLNDSSESVNKTRRLHETITSPTQEFIRRKGHASIASPDSESILRKGYASVASSDFEMLLDEDQKEHIRFSQLGRKKDFAHIVRIDGRYSSPDSESIRRKGYASIASPDFETLLDEDQKEHIRFSQLGRKKDFAHSVRIEGRYSSPDYESIRRKGYASIASPDFEKLLDEMLLDEDQKEHIRFSQLGRKKDFAHVERIEGRPKNIVQGIELHTNVFNAEEQNTIVQYIYRLQRMGRKGLLRERTYSEPRKWMRGKGRVTVQFGCCYNYAVDRNGNPPGIIRDEEVDPLPPLFKQMIKRMVRWHILPPTCIPNSCIVNIYDEGDCIPPHIDHHDFLRPFCTVSFLTECNILFGSNLKVLSPGEFSGPVSIPLPVGSVLILNGNGADIAKHCVPAVPAKRISITFRKMDDSKLPYEYSPDPELMGIKPMVCSALNESPMEQNGHHKPRAYPPLSNSSSESSKKTNGNTFMVEDDEFPPLGSSSKSGNWVRFTRRG